MGKRKEKEGARDREGERREEESVCGDREFVIGAPGNTCYQTAHMPEKSARHALSTGSSLVRWL